MIMVFLLGLLSTLGKPSWGLETEGGWTNGRPQNDKITALTSTSATGSSCKCS